MNVLAVAPHPDDETLGACGTLLKHIEMGHNVFWLIATKSQNETLQKEQITTVKNAYGFKKTYELKFPTAKLHAVDFSDIINAVSGVINDIKPEIVYTNNRSDIHTDHQIMSKAVFSCTKSFRYPFIKKILMYECISETDAMPQLHENAFLPNVFCDITDYIEKKLEIMKIYETEIGEPPFPRSIEAIKALAAFRGAGCYAKYAEAFMLVREIM